MEQRAEVCVNVTEPQFLTAVMRFEICSIMSMFLECAFGVRVMYLHGKTLHVKGDIVGCSLK